jgi:hypothetical protein
MHYLDLRRLDRSSPHKNEYAFALCLSFGGCTKGVPNPESYLLPENGKSTHGDILLSALIRQIATTPEKDCTQGMHNPVKHIYPSNNRTQGISCSLPSKSKTRATRQHVRGA